MPRLAERDCSEIAPAAGEGAATPPPSVDAGLFRAPAGRNGWAARDYDAATGLRYNWAPLRPDRRAVERRGPRRVQRGRRGVVPLPRRWPRGGTAALTRRRPNLGRGRGRTPVRGRDSSLIPTGSRGWGVAQTIAPAGSFGGGPLPTAAVATRGASEGC
jgi:hypothetical protein